MVDASPDTIIAVSEAYLRATMTAREGILGRPLFEVFPDNPGEPGATGTGNLRASLARVAHHLAPDTMAVQKYGIPRRDGMGFEERYWSPVNTPVVVDGRLRYIIHRVEDVTGFAKAAVHARAGADDAADLLPGSRLEHELYERAQDLQRANQDLRAQQERSEEQLRQAQKLEAVGRLAAGIAHDFNNLLSVVLSYSEELLRDLPEGSQSRQDVAEVKRAGERAADLTRQLLVFSRQQVLAPKILDLNAVLTSLGRLLARVVGEDVHVVMRLCPDPGQVKVDPSQIEQVVLNLVVNARDAMPHGGTLTIATSNVDLDEGYASGHFDVTPGRYVMFSVSDTGAGMDQATQARIFEPFFTTKPQGQGTGLGLSTVFGIVKQSRGSIWVYSEPGHGTEFKVYLPRVDAPAERAPIISAAPRGTETVLLVEDEPHVRAVACRVLERAGYAVLVAADPLDALRIAGEAGPIDLLLTDVVMPHMNGRELAERIRAVRPGLRVLFTSGYTDDAILRHGVLDEGVPFLQKPITPSALARRVRETLDS